MTLACNGDGTLHWTATVVNTSACPQPGAWLVPLLVHLDTGRTLVVRLAAGSASFAPGTTLLQGDFCYSFSPHTQSVQADVLLAGQVCVRFAASPAIAPCGVSPTCTLGFLDLPPSAEYYDDVMALAAVHAAPAYADGTFRPDQPITRGALASILAPAFHLAAPAAQFGAPSGDAPPARTVTRGELARQVVLAAGWPVLVPPVATFADVPPGSPFFAYVETAAAHGIVHGYADRTFRPNQPATRGQAARVIVNALPSPLAPALGTPTPVALPGAVTATPTAAPPAKGAPRP